MLTNVYYMLATFISSCSCYLYYSVCSNQIWFALTTVALVKCRSELDYMKKIDLSKSATLFELCTL